MEDVTIVGMTKNHAAAVLHAVAVAPNYTMMDRCNDCCWCCWHLLIYVDESSYTNSN